MIVVLTPAAVSVCIVPDTPVPDVMVVIEWLAKPLVPLKSKMPAPPLDILVTLITGNAADGVHAPGTEMAFESVVTVPPAARARPDKLAPCPIVMPAASMIVPKKVEFAPKVVAAVGAQKTSPAQAPFIVTIESAAVFSAPTVAPAPGLNT